jgi:uncharacterized membrane protein
METKFTSSGWLSLTWLKFLIITLLVLGFFFRFVNLDQKAYWFDEASTSLQISGYSDGEVIQQIADGRIISVQDLQSYQYPSPEKTAIDTMKGLATKEPQLTPLYFVMARFWVQWFGNSVAVTRSLSAVISLLAFPGIYWLCLELFESPLTGWIAIAFLAVSPFHILYAQEARPYSLWTVTILLSNASLLRAMRVQTQQSWGIYATTIILGLYSHLLSALIVIAHGVYIGVIERFRLTKRLIAYGIASGLGLITFTPWIFFALTNLQKTNEQSWQAVPESFLNLVKGWVRGISLFFVDFGLNDRSPSLYLIGFSIILIVLLILVVYSIYFLCRYTPKSIWLFILTSMIVPALALLLPDLIIGGFYSTVTRYLIPGYLCMQLTMAYLFATKITAISVQEWQNQLWKTALIALISLGVWSGGIIAQSETWWTKADDNVNHHLAQIIHRSHLPLVVSDAYFVRMLSLSHSLDSKVRVQLLTEPKIPQIPDVFSDVFLYYPSERLRKGLEKEYKIQPVDSPSLWKLEK